MDWTHRPQNPAEWFDLLGAECFGPGVTREELERQEVAHVCDIYSSRRRQEEKKKERALLPQIIALFDLMLAIVEQIIARVIASAKSCNTPTPEVRTSGHPLAHIELTPHLLAQRPAPARVCAGLPN